MSAATRLLPNTDNLFRPDPAALHPCRTAADFSPLPISGHWLFAKLDRRNAGCGALSAGPLLNVEQAPADVVSAGKPRRMASASQPWVRLRCLSRRGDAQARTTGLFAAVPERRKCGPTSACQGSEAAECWANIIQAAQSAFTPNNETALAADIVGQVKTYGRRPISRANVACIRRVRETSPSTVAQVDR